MNRRNAVLALAALVTAPLAALAQAPGKVWRVGILAQGARPAAPGGDSFGAFVRGMRELGYVEGKNLAIEWRYAEDKLENLPALAAELVALKPDALVSGANAGPLALQLATSTIPIVMTSPGEAVAIGLVKNLALPGGNTTGHSGIDLSGKRLELLLAKAPNASPVALLLNPGNPISRAILDETNAAAKALGVKMLPVETRIPQELESAFSAMAKQKARAVYVSADPLFSTNRSRLAELALKHRLPMISMHSAFPDHGGLMSFGANRLDLLRRAATLVDRILKGAKPAGLPVERPTKFELVINLKTAKALGITIPQSILLRAERVIE
jgi:putative ABC transport system substrate-binding protein